MTSVAEFVISASHAKIKMDFFPSYIDYITVIDLLFTYGRV